MKFDFQKHGLWFSESGDGEIHSEIFPVEIYHKKTIILSKR